MIPLSDLFRQCFNPSVCPAEDFYALAKWLIVDRSSPLPESVRGVAIIIAADQDHLTELREVRLAKDRERKRTGVGSNGIQRSPAESSGVRGIGTPAIPAMPCHSMPSESMGASAPKPPPTKAKRFVTPSVAEVSAYCREQGYANVDAERFVAFYESKGWLVGKSPMKDWRAAVRGWHQREGAGASVRVGAVGTSIRNSSDREEDYVL